MSPAKDERKAKDEIFEKLSDHYVGKEFTLDVRYGEQIVPAAVWEHCEGYLISAKVNVDECEESEGSTITFTIDHSTDLREVFDDPDTAIVGGPNRCVEWTLYKVNGL
jgi:hypothetical protein